MNHNQSVTLIETLGILFFLIIPVVCPFVQFCFLCTLLNHLLSSFVSLSCLALLAIWFSQLSRVHSYLILSLNFCSIAYNLMKICSLQKYSLTQCCLYHLMFSTYCIGSDGMLLSIDSSGSIHYACVT